MADESYMLAGMHKVINPQNIKNDIDYERLEKEYMGKIKPTESKDPNIHFNAELQKLAEQVGISFDEVNDEKAASTTSNNDSSSSHHSSSNNYTNDYSSPHKTYNNSSYNNSSNHDYSYKTSYDSGDSSSKYNDTKTYDDKTYDDIFKESSLDVNLDDDSTYNDTEKSVKFDVPDDDKYSSYDGYSHKSDDDDKYSSHKSYDSSHDNSSYDGSSYSSSYNNSSYSGSSYNNSSYGSSEMSQMTDEQMKQQQINSIVNDLSGNNNQIWDLNEDKREEEKSIKMAEIELFKENLMEDGLDVDKYSLPSDPTYQEVDSLHKVLRIKCDRMRCCTMAEEFLLLGAHGLEELFDGNKTWFGRRPDLTGWHNSVNSKLRRMRSDTSTLVSSVMSDYNIGPGTRIFLELIPNMFMYSKTRKRQYDQPQLYSDDDMSSDLSNIRNFDSNL